MNQDKVKRFEDIFRKNNNQGIAIAITGSWGVGKTFFWNKFLDSQLSEECIYTNRKVFNRKYAYVSLFGVESLSDLKTQIYSNIESYHSTIEVPKWLKSLSSIFKDARVTQLGINAPLKLIDNLLFNQVKDAIICFDDFERMSNKLDIKDVMGLANQLKLEKNCQVILILDEDKAEGENKKKYAEYKEKLIDETIIINSVEPLIRENAKDIDKELIDLIVKFSDVLNIHNFRFFQKVINLYKSFRAELPEIVAYSTKEIILIRILQGYFISDFGEKFEFGWDDIKNIGFEENRENWSKNKIRTFSLIEEYLPFYFLKIDQWMIEFKSQFNQLRNFDHNLINKLIVSDLISERHNKASQEVSTLINSYHAFNIDSTSRFVNRLFLAIKAVYKYESFENIEFYCSILEEFQAEELVYKINDLLMKHIDNELKSNREQFLKNHFWQKNEENKLRQYIKNIITTTPSDDKYALSKVVKHYLKEGQIQYGTEEILSLVTKDSLRDFILEIYLQNFSNISIRRVISIIIYLYTSKCFNRLEEIKVWIREILEEKGSRHKYPEKYMQYILDEK
ncbi:hypothetical protein [Acinetobacter sp. KS-LM10]|uniref:hypothetical protein n=1 Tax=Acinetobacter sp. KS-LM10 TaxID=3120518 RepID=UPI0030CCC8E4